MQTSIQEVSILHVFLVRDDAFLLNYSSFGRKNNDAENSHNIEFNGETNFVLTCR